ncbi:MAG: enoyl-CoA hydratase/isomerase family protein [Sphingomonadaceae bacterium]|nr:enoyl-CoA hydratase/isomerase family protein [Sphingomonadaceae bacterium]
MLESERLWLGGADWDKAVAFVDLDAAAQVPDQFVLPSCPVIGIGSIDAPLAGVLDAVIEAPVTPDMILQQVLAKPRAAAAIAQLLRLLPSLAPEQGLTAESFAYAMLQGSEEHRLWSMSAAETPKPKREPGHVRISRNEAEMAIVMERAEAANAIDRAMRDALYEGFALASLDPTIRRVRLSAEGKAFSLGAELGEFGTTGDPATAHAIRGATLPARMALRCSDKLEVHIQGACVGAGLEIAAFAKRITADRSAWFQLPELSMGILPGAGGCVSLTRRIGRQRAALMILSGRRLSARQALSWGLIDAIVDDPA